jgi:hypothetical protein
LGYLKILFEIFYFLDDFWTIMKKIAIFAIVCEFGHTYIVHMTAKADLGKTIWSKL